MEEERICPFLVARMITLSSLPKRIHRLQDTSTAPYVTPLGGISVETFTGGRITGMMTMLKYLTGHLRRQKHKRR